MTEQLTDRQAEILGVLRQSVMERGYPPSVREVGSAVGISSSSVARQINELENKGYLRRDAGSRAITIVSDPPEVDVAGLCHWVQNRGGCQDQWTHEAFHFGNTCPYEVVAAVLRGEPDPRDVDGGA